MKPRIELPSDQNATGRTLGEEEMAALSEVIASGVLTSTKGHFVRDLEQAFARLLGVRHAFACSSGTAAIHAAIAALDPEPGEEIVTTPITDMGALTPILYQGAIPVFCDVDPRTLNVTAETIEARITSRTRAIVVTHLFGNPCEMAAILEVAGRHRLPVIEDCAQAYLARYDGRFVGTFGAIGCFSLQQGKHITTGEGGIVVTNDDALARRIFLFINKAWGYGDPAPDHDFLALNYRMTELQGAVGLAQLARLEGVVADRVKGAERLTRRISGIPGLHPPRVPARGVHTYWKYALHLDEGVIPQGVVALAERLRGDGILSAPRYIQKPAFRCEVFEKRRTFGRSGYPFTLASPEALDYDPARFPGTFAGLSRVLVLPWNERYQEAHIDFLADRIEAACATLREG